MELRPELREPEVPPELLAELCAAIEQIEDLHWRGEPTEAAIAAFNARMGSTLELYDWAKTAEEILESLARFCRRISGAGD